MFKLYNFIYFNSISFQIMSFKKIIQIQILFSDQHCHRKSWNADQPTSGLQGHPGQAERPREQVRIDSRLIFLSNFVFLQNNLFTWSLPHVLLRSSVVSLVVRDFLNSQLYSLKQGFPTFLCLHPPRHKMRPPYCYQCTQVNTTLRPFASPRLGTPALKQTSWNIM